MKSQNHIFLFPLAITFNAEATTQTCSPGARRSYFYCIKFLPLNLCFKYLFKSVCFWLFIRRNIPLSAQNYTRSQSWRCTGLYSLLVYTVNVPATVLTALVLVLFFCVFFFFEKTLEPHSHRVHFKILFSCSPSPVSTPCQWRLMADGRMDDSIHIHSQDTSCLTCEDLSVSKQHVSVSQWKGEEEKKECLNIRTWGTSPKQSLKEKKGGILTI